MITKWLIIFKNLLYKNWQIKLISAILTFFCGIFLNNNEGL